MGDSDRETGTRRTEGVLTGGRSARVVDAVLKATAEELSRVGYAAMRVEDVAERSGVNKTTIYRRWPSKPELVAAALSSATIGKEPPDTGNVREDLLHMVREMIAFAGTRTGRGLVRVLQVERADAEVDKLARTLRAGHRATRVRVIERAVARGELPQGTNAVLVVELIFAPVVSRVVTFGEKLDDATAAEIVDTILAGVRARAR